MAPPPAASPDPPAARPGRMAGFRRVGLLLVGLVAAMALAEGVVRLVGDDLPEVDRWPDATTATKVAQMDRLGCADVVFVGNSVARDGFDPATFTVHDPGGRTAYNAALDAASPAQLARWLPQQVLPRLRPGVVVWAVTSPDLNDASPAGRAALDSYTSSIGGRDDLVGRLQRPLLDHLALARHRDALTDPPVLWESLTSGDADGAEGDDDAGDAAATGLIGPLGEGRSRRELTYRPGDPVTRRFVQDQLLHGFDLGGEQVDAARALIERLDADGIEVVLVVPPVTPEFVELHPEAGAWEEYRAAVDRLADDTGAALVDLADVADESWFADTHHLNGLGAARFTEAVAAALEGTGAGARCRRGR